MSKNRSHTQRHNISQDYKLINRGAETTFKYRDTINIVTNKIEGYKHVYISKNVQIKPRKVHEINKLTDDAMKDYKIHSDRKPIIIIVTADELGVYAKYDAINNVIFYIDLVLLENNRTHKKEVIYHEMWHCRQAQNYLLLGNTITLHNYSLYIEQLNILCKKKLDEIGINAYNVSEISEYALRKYYAGRFDEVDAEYESLKIIGG